MRLTDIMSGADLTIWPEIGMVLFALGFGAIVLRLLGKGQQDTYEHVRHFPLEDDDG